MVMPADESKPAPKAKPKPSGAKGRRSATQAQNGEPNLPGMPAANDIQ
jgi:hypothetical protein